jgi:hypothetical protein
MGFPSLQVDRSSSRSKWHGPGPPSVFVCFNCETAFNQTWYRMKCIVTTQGHAIIIIYLFYARLMSLARWKIWHGRGFLLAKWCIHFDEHSTGYASWQYRVLRKWVLVLVGLDCKVFRKLGTYLQPMSNSGCPRDGVEGVVTVEVPLLNNFFFFYLFLAI